MFNINNLSKTHLINSLSKTYPTPFQIKNYNNNSSFHYQLDLLSGDKYSPKICQYRLPSSQIHLPSNDHILLGFFLTSHTCTHTLTHTYTPTHGPDQQRYLVHDTPAILPLCEQTTKRTEKERTSTTISTPLSSFFHISSCICDGWIFFSSGIFFLFISPRLLKEEILVRWQEKVKVGCACLLAKLWVLGRLEKCFSGCFRNRFVRWLLQKAGKAVPLPPFFLSGSKK